MKEGEIFYSPKTAFKRKEIENASKTEKQF